MQNGGDILDMVILLMQDEDIYESFYQVWVPGNIILWPEGRGVGEGGGYIGVFKYTYQG